VTQLFAAGLCTVTHAQTTQQWQLDGGPAVVATTITATDSDTSPVETCRKWYATEVRLLVIMLALEVYDGTTCCIHDSTKLSSVWHSNE
jgi:hypothetical protein